jgi:hypothetical protein
LGCSHFVNSVGRFPQLGRSNAAFFCNHSSTRLALCLWAYRGLAGEDAGVRSGIRLMQCEMEISTLDSRNSGIQPDTIACGEIQNPQDVFCAISQSKLVSLLLSVMTQITSNCRLGLSSIWKAAYRLGRFYPGGRQARTCLLRGRPSSALG